MHTKHFLVTVLLMGSILYAAQEPTIPVAALQAIVEDVREQSHYEFLDYYLSSGLSPAAKEKLVTILRERATYLQGVRDSHVRTWYRVYGLGMVASFAAFMAVHDFWPTQERGTFCKIFILSVLVSAHVTVALGGFFLDKDYVDIAGDEQLERIAELLALCDADNKE